MGGPLSWSNSYALEFDATNEAVSIDQDYSSTYAGSFSLNFWVKSDNTTAQYYWAAEGANYSTGDRLWVRSNNGGGFSVKFRAGGAETLWTSATTPMAGDSTWRNVGITLTKSATGTTATVIAAYIGGEAITMNVTSGATTATEHAQWDEDRDTQIARVLYGDGSTTTSAAFLIDEVGLWNRALSAANHAAIYNSGAAMNLQANSGDYNTSADLVAYFRFEEGSGSSTANLISGGDVGTLINSVAFRNAGI